mgnify:CR=1 FL=1
MINSSSLNSSSDKIENYINLELGSIIRTVREQKNLTQVQLGELLFFTEEFIIRLENGESTPTKSICIEIANQLEIPLEIFEKKIKEKNLKKQLKAVEIKQTEIRNALEQLWS